MKYGILWSLSPACVTLFYLLCSPPPPPPLLPYKKLISGWIIHTKHYSLFVFFTCPWEPLKMLHILLKYSAILYTKMSNKIYRFWNKLLVLNLISQYSILKPRITFKNYDLKFDEVSGCWVNAEFRLIIIRKGPNWMNN